MITQAELYNSILTARYYIAEHANILLDFQMNGDIAFKKQREKLVKMILYSQPLERHYLMFNETEGEELLLEENEITLLISRLSELSFLPLKNM